jgi:hypothetical protein
MIGGICSAPFGSAASILGQPVAVGRHAPQHRRSAALGGVHVDAVEVVARLLGRDREPRLVDQLRHVRRRQAEADAQLLLPDRRELVGRQGGQVEDRAGGADRDLARLPVLLDRDRAAVGQLADDVEEGVGRDRRGAGAGDVRPPRWATSDRSMSVAVRADPLGVRASLTLERIGMVVRRSTTFWTWLRDRNRAARSIDSFMDRACRWWTRGREGARGVVPPRGGRAS